MNDTESIAGYLKRSHGRPKTRQGRCRDCGADYPCASLRAAEEIERLTAERDEWKLRALELSGIEDTAIHATQCAEAAARERDEAQQEIERLRDGLAVVDRLIGEEVRRWNCTAAGGTLSIPMTVTSWDELRDVFWDDRTGHPKHLGPSPKADVEP